MKGTIRKTVLLWTSIALAISALTATTVVLLVLFYPSTGGRSSIAFVPWFVLLLVGLPLTDKVVTFCVLYRLLVLPAGPPIHVHAPPEQ